MHGTTLRTLALTSLLLAALGCAEEAESPTAPAPAAATAAALSFRELSGGGESNCGITTDDRAYCWGNNGLGTLGNGTTTGSTRPVAVAGGLRFRTISARSAHACGVTTENRLYCWGYNGSGQLGVGTSAGPDGCLLVAAPCSTRPVAVAGNLRFRAVAVANQHTCAITTDDRLWCWGDNLYGQLGIGTRSGPERCSSAPCSTRPVAVKSGLTFRQATGGRDHTCALSTTNLAFCWGRNDRGQLGDSTQVALRTTPVPVSGGHRYGQISGGDRLTCAVSRASRAFCWGDGATGGLGNGKTYVSFWPRRVAGQLLFDQVEAASCGVTGDARAYCWGDNTYGQLGDGTTTVRLTPVPVAGGLRFTQVTAAGLSSCGLTPSGVAYCWGRNAWGQLGDGTTTERHTPTRVLGPL